MSDQIKPYLYLSFICLDVQSLQAVERAIVAFKPKLLSVEVEGDITQHRFTIDDINLLQAVEKTMTEIHNKYRKFRYFIVMEDGFNEGHYRVYINKKGKKVVTKKAKKRIGFHY